MNEKDQRAAASARQVIGATRTGKLKVSPKDAARLLEAMASARSPVHREPIKPGRARSKGARP